MWALLAPTILRSQACRRSRPLASISLSRWSTVLMRKANGHPPSVEARYVLAFFQKLTSLVGIEACAFASLAARSMIREFLDAIPGQWLISSLGSFFACLMSAGTVCVSLLATSRNASLFFYCRTGTKSQLGRRSGRL
jgi:hypothetical protein